MAVPYIKLDENREAGCKNLLFDQEVAGSKVYYHVLSSGEFFASEENGKTLRIFFHIEGKAVYRSQGQQQLFEERAVFVPHPDQRVLIQAKERTCILEIQWELLGSDKIFMEKAETKYPYVQVYSQCEKYYEDNGGNDITQRSIIDHHAMPRFAMGSNEAKGPDQMAEQSHPLVDQMFFSFPENKVVLIIDDERIVMEGNTLLHVTLGARHAVEIPKDGLMHYMWIDFLIDPGAMAFLDAAHQKM